MFLGCIFLANYALSLPHKAADIFGPPTNTLTSQQRMTFSIQLLLKANDLTSPTDPNGAPQQFEIQLGEAADSVIQRLGEQGLISDTEAFRTFLLYSGLDTRMQAGTHTLSPAMTPVELAQTLEDATPDEVTFTLLAGWRIEEVAAAIPSTGLEIAPDEFITAAASRPPDGYSFAAEIPEGASLEGFLFPGVYVLRRGTTAQELITVLLDSFEVQVTAEIRDGFASQGLTLREGVTLASILQREAVVEDEYPAIASVFLNRLNINMRLDADPTVQYALGFNSAQAVWWTNPLSTADLGFDSPYKTYIYTGIPPGPIANPSLSAMRAVAFPAQTPYYYFRARCDGSGRHNFAITYEEHVGNGCE